MSPQNGTLNGILLFIRSTCCIASSANTSHIVANDHSTKLTQVQKMLMASPAIDEDSTTEDDSSSGKIPLKNWPMSKIAYPDCPHGPNGTNTDIMVPVGTIPCTTRRSRYPVRIMKAKARPMLTMTTETEAVTSAWDMECS